MNKKGFFFSVISIGLVMVLIALFLTYQIRDSKTDITVDQVRISTMSSFADNIELQLIGDGFEISGRQALASMEAQVTGQGTTSPISNPEASMADIMINGDAEYAFYTQYDKLKTLAERSGIDLVIYYPEYQTSQTLRDISPADLNIRQEDPWGITVSTDSQARLVLKSENPKIEIKRDFVPEKRIEIRNSHNDPLYLREGITRGIFTKDSIDQGDLNFPNTPAEVQATADGVTFIATPNGISYLDRFTSDAIQSQHGIERLVTPNQESLPHQGEFSATDWQYFYQIGGSCVQGISRTADCGTTGFGDYRLDANHISEYNLNSCLCEENVGCESGRECSSLSCDDFCSERGGSVGGVAGSYSLPDDGSYCIAEGNVESTNCCRCNDPPAGGDDDVPGEQISQAQCTVLCNEQGFTAGGCSGSTNADSCFIDPPGSACESTYVVYTNLGTQCITGGTCVCQTNNCCDGVGTCTEGAGCVA